MSGLGDNEYSFSLTTFSPSGKLGQIEHALSAVEAGSTSLGIKEKKLPTTLIDPASVEKVTSICDSIGAVYSGMGPDSRVLINKARKFAEAYRQQYGEAPPCKMCLREIGAVMQDFTQSGGVRPFGVSLLVAGFDADEPKLYQVDPSGSFFAWKAAAIGKNMVNSRTFLEKRYHADIEIEDAVNTAILTLKESFDGEMKEDNIEIGILTMADRKFRVLTPAEVADYLKEIE